VKYLFAPLLALAAMAQAPLEPPACALRGVVREATTHVPLDGVRVWAGASSTTTGLQGQFAFQNLDPGRHWISVEDASRAASGGAFVLLNAGQAVTGMEIYIKTGGAISGTVLDENRHPISGALVVLLETVFESGQTAYRPKLTESTDANGDYKLQPVPSGRGFLLLAAPPAPSGSEIPREFPALVFYPGSPDVQAAQSVAIGAGEDRRGMDFQLASEPAFCIGGVTRASEAAIHRQLDPVFTSSAAPVKAAVSKGHFRACGFNAGLYRVVATGADIFRNRRWSDSAEVSVTDHNVLDVQVSPASAAAIAGETAWETPRQDGAPDTRILVGLKNLREKHAEETQVGPFRSGRDYGVRARVPGQFALDGLTGDDYALDIRDIPEGCYVKEATFGGVGVLHRIMRLTAADGRLRIVLACDAGSVIARVTDRDGNAVSHVSLYVMPEDANSPAALSEVLQRAEVENGWSGIVTPLPPGKYRVLACDLELDGTAGPLIQLWRARAKAREVEIGPGETAQVILEIEDGL
jgi:hypothetical protein